MADQEGAFAEEGIAAYVAEVLEQDAGDEADIEAGSSPRSAAVTVGCTARMPTRNGTPT